MTFDEARQLSAEIHGHPRKNRAAIERWKAKAKWEHRSMLAVLMEWGDPRGWR